ncbi:MAG: hypothetical protein WCC31_02685 [Terracidiphilus sp.]
MRYLDENRRMSLLRILMSLFGRSAQSEIVDPRSIVLLQRRLHRFSKEELQSAGEHGWSKKFDGKEDPMYFVFADSPILTVVRAGTHTIRVTTFPARYNEDDEYALSQLPQPEQKQAWNEHHAFVLLEFFNDLSSKAKRIPDVEAYSSLAKLALHLGDPNCSAIVMPVKNIMMPNDGTAEEGLRLLVNKILPLQH